VQEDVIKQIMKNRLSDTDLREALRRKEDARPPDDVPDDFVDSVLAKIDAGIDATTDAESAPKTIKIWRGVAAAAGIALIVGIGALMMTMGNDNTAQPIASVTESETYSPKRSPYIANEVEQPQQIVVNTPKKREQTPKTEPAAPQKADRELGTSPAKMDELIASLAQMQGAEKKVFDCETDEAVYVFEDNDDLNLFGRLILAASNYPDDTEGYFLNYSAEKFFFCIDDETNGDGYLWTAEKTDNGKIMLYCSHSPAGIADESDCFKNFARKITYGNMNTVTDL
jgi:hypothetical protein